MKVLFRTTSRKSRGGVAHRDQEFDVPVLRIGRGADCEAHLSDPRVMLHHAEVAIRANGAFIDAQNGADLSVNGRVTASSRLQAGDKITLGPYDLEVLPAEADKDLVLEIELVRPLGDDLAELKLRSSTKITRVLLGKRGWSYALFIPVLVVFLVLPLIAFFGKTELGKAEMMKSQQGTMLATIDRVWLSGQISNAHKFFGQGCESCHQVPFKQVRDEACLTCHEKITHHVNTEKFAYASFKGESCESCHKEHNGPREIRREDQVFCASCHATITQQAAASGLSNSSDFGRDHPQFKATVVTDSATAKFERIAVDANPREHSGLKFPHDKHLNPAGVRSPRVSTPVKMECASCHQPETGGQLFRPVTFEANCASCHLLSFEPMALDRKLPHAKPEEALIMVRDTYASLALRGGVNEPSAPEAVRRRPGQQLTETEKQDALAWADRKADEVISGKFGKGMCGECHVINDKANAATWEVVPAIVTQRWMPKGAFDHSRHHDVECATCHAAAKSSTAEDVLLPGVKVCQDCHGGEQSTAKVPSTCVSCHGFHLPGMAPMGNAANKPGKAALALPPGHITQAVARQ